MLAPDADPALLPDPDAAPPEPDGPLPHVARCLNCGEPVSLTYCPRCGQEAKDYTAALRPLLAEALAEWVSWDSKLLRTLLPLLFKPGLLTREYNAGRRVRYLSPLKMYLVISALFFLVVGWRHPLQVPPSVHISEASPGVHVNVGAASALKAASANDVPVVVIGSHRRSLNDLPRTVAAYDAGQRALPPARRDAPALRAVVRQIIKARTSPRAFLQTMLDGLLDNAPKMMFFLVPVFALLLRLTYWRARRLYVEHLIFALHSHAFAYLILILLVLLPNSARPFAALLSLCIPVYLFLALRVVYGQGFWKTAFKMLWLGGNYLLLLLFALLVTAGIAFLLA